MSGSDWALAAALLVGLVAFVMFVTFSVNRQRAMVKAHQDSCDYVTFEAYPSDLPFLEADLADHRWKLAQSEPLKAGSFLYRFEKADSHAAPLSKVLDFERSMKRTSGRKDQSHGPIKIKAQGMKRDLNA
ncbi:MAG TPA: hypothetical protein VFZ35_08580 [Sphingomicrobium sp.]